MPVPLQKNSHIFHYTDVKNIANILQDGIQPRESHRDRLEQMLTEVMEAHSLEWSIDRTECVFFYPCIPVSFKERGFDLDIHPLVPKQAIMIIDAGLVDRNWYVGDFKLFSEAIDFQFMSEPDDTMVTESLEEALVQYGESVVEIESFETLPELCNQLYIPEIFTEEAIRSEAIVKCILNDKYFSEFLV